MVYRGRLGVFVANFTSHPINSGTMFSIFNIFLTKQQIILKNVWMILF